MAVDLFVKHFAQRAKRLVEEHRPTITTRIRIETYDHTTRRYVGVPGGTIVVDVPLPTTQARQIGSGQEVWDCLHTAARIFGEIR